jgi:cation-transporting ATPase 13A2
MVVNIGYGTRRGRIIRKILTRVTKAPDFFKTALIFLVETLIIGVIIYLATLPLLLRLEIVPAYVVYRFLDFLGWTFPPPLPIYFNLAYSFALGRLRGKNINGTEPEKTLEAAKLKAFCFDKTGTLTQNEIEVHEIIKFKN